MSVPLFGTDVEASFGTGERLILPPALILPPTMAISEDGPGSLGVDGSTRREAGLALWIAGFTGDTGGPGTDPDAVGVLTDVGSKASVNTLRADKIILPHCNLPPTSSTAPLAFLSSTNVGEAANKSTTRTGFPKCSPRKITHWNFAIVRCFNCNWQAASVPRTDRTVVSRNKFSFDSGFVTPDSKTNVLGKTRKSSSSKDSHENASEVGASCWIDSRVNRAFGCNQSEPPGRTYWTSQRAIGNVSERSKTAKYPSPTCTYATTGAPIPGTRISQRSCSPIRANGP